MKAMMLLSTLIFCFATVAASASDPISLDCKFKIWKDEKVSEELELKEADLRNVDESRWLMESSDKRFKFKVEVTLNSFFYGNKNVLGVDVTDSIKNTKNRSMATFSDLGDLIFKGGDPNRTGTGHAYSAVCSLK